MELRLDSGGRRLGAVVAHPEPDTDIARGLVLCHGTPGEEPSDASYVELATSLAEATGWRVLTFDFAAGSVSLSQAITDIHTAVDHLAGLANVSGVWLAGFSVGGALALCVGGEREEIRGVAAFGAPAELDEWVEDPGRVHPLQLISKIPPRPVLLVHGDHDDVVPVADARALADAAGGEVELRILAGGGHGLRHDPRATAVLEGWLDGQPSG